MLAELLGSRYEGKAGFVSRLRKLLTAALSSSVSLTDIGTGTSGNRREACVLVMHGTVNREDDEWRNRQDTA